MKSNPIIKELFYNHPTKQWHFEQLRKEAGLSRAQTNEWLKKLLQDNFITRTKQQGKMPHYLANYQHPHYQNSKRLYALEKMHESGLLDYLVSLEKVEIVVLFGSFSRWDWYDGSDIDIFIYGDVDEMYVSKFGLKLKREIQIFSGKNEKDLKKMGPALLKSIIKGITIKGSISEEVITHAAV
ncbi:MAG: nucleotidyltransferase domain-containing protein [Nanoarchaeota archaeon]